MANNYETIASSYHEAAHTIVGLAHLIYIDNVSISEGNGGDTNYLIYHVDNTNDQSLKRLIIMSELRTVYAGLVGEKIFYEDICGSHLFPMHLKNGSSFDISTGAAIIRKYKLADAGEKTYALKQEIKHDCHKFLDKHWESVKIVAHALYRKKKMNFSELKYLLTRNNEHKDFWKDKFKKIKLIYDEEKQVSEKVVKNLITSK